MRVCVKVVIVESRGRDRYIKIIGIYKFDIGFEREGKGGRRLVLLEGLLVWSSMWFIFEIKKIEKDYKFGCVSI